MNPGPLIIPTLPHISPEYNHFQETELEETIHSKLVSI